jgi:hypothetical protein
LRRKGDAASLIRCSTTTRLAFASGDSEVTADCGIVYVATNHDRYVEEAFLSADSIKQRNPNLPVTLFTDLPEHALCNTSRFDAVLPIAGVQDIGSRWAGGQLNRLRCLARTPYARTLHLDTDTRVLTDELLSLFSLLEAYDAGLVETVPDASYSRQHFGKPMFSAGFVLFRKTDLVWTWLQTWEELSDRNFRWAGETPLPYVSILKHIADEEVRRRLLNMDQISLAELLSPEVNLFGLAVNNLDYCWNHSGSRQARNNRKRVRILHTHALKWLTHADLLARAFTMKQSGETRLAQQIDDYLRSKYAE